jgi:hypothetical protein
MLNSLNKRGSAWSLEFIIKMIIAILCIFLILIVINSLFGAIQAKHKLNQAKASLNGIVDLANGLISSEKVRGEYLFVSPKLEGHLLFFDSDGKKICILTQDRNIYACEELNYDFVHTYYSLDENCNSVYNSNNELKQEHSTLSLVPFRVIAQKKYADDQTIYFTHLYSNDKCSSERVDL